jgi:hypothetical protein
MCLAHVFELIDRGDAGYELPGVGQGGEARQAFPVGANQTL